MILIFLQATTVLKIYIGKYLFSINSGFLRGKTIIKGSKNVKMYSVKTLNVLFDTSLSNMSGKEIRSKGVICLAVLLWCSVR